MVNNLSVPQERGRVKQMTHFTLEHYMAVKKNMEALHGLLWKDFQTTLLTEEKIKYAVICITKGDSHHSKKKKW